MVVVDLPGHGRSQLDEPFSFEQAAEAVERSAIHAGLERPVLAGHSMGGACGRWLHGHPFLYVPSVPNYE
jgi:pimeloyl-ACP methyl ester carboxylesterase